MSGQLGIESSLRAVLEAGQRSLTARQRGSAIESVDGLPVVEAQNSGNQPAPGKAGDVFNKNSSAAILSACVRQAGGQCARKNLLIAFSRHLRVVQSGNQGMNSGNWAQILRTESPLSRRH